MSVFATAARTLLLATLLLGPPGGTGTAAAQDFGITQVQPPTVQQLPKLPGWGGPEATKLAIEEALAWPVGAPRPAGQVVVRFTIEPTGAVDSLRIVRGLSAEADAAVLAAVRRLPAFVPGRQGGQPVRVAYTLGVALQPPPAGETLDRYRDAQTRQQGVAQRVPGEADSAFVRRVLPVAYAHSHDLLAYAWRPGAFGKQLFFSVYGEAGNEYGTNLFVLDPYQENTYSVQILPVVQADDTYLSAIFFDDTNHDGRKELLTLATYSLLDQMIEVDGQQMYGRTTHHHTDIWQYRGPDPAGRPQYRQLPGRASLDELETAADVRAELAAPVRRPKAAAKARR